MQKYLKFNLFFFLCGVALLFWSCSEGKIPTALEPPRELHAIRASASQKPVIDGRADDAVWGQTSSYKVFLDESSGGVHLAGDGVLMTFRAVWWKEVADTTQVDSARVDTTFARLVAFLVTWPDADKGIQKATWSYDPSDSRWTQNSVNSDWLTLFWSSPANELDVWYWDAAITNPMGYFQDMVIERFESGEDVTGLYVSVDDLNFFNDTETERNTWDLNYDDNKTPRDSADDRPRFAWTGDPSMPPVFSASDENNQFLLKADADLLQNTPYVAPTTAVEIPGYVLEEPSGGSADIAAYGRHENGQWTLEFVRAVTGSDNNDVVLNPEDRYFSQVFSVALGNNTASPFDNNAQPLQINNSVILTFEFRR